MNTDERANQFAKEYVCELLGITNETPVFIPRALNRGMFTIDTDKTKTSDGRAYVYLRHETHVHQNGFCPLNAVCPVAWEDWNRDAYAA